MSVNKQKKNETETGFTSQINACRCKFQNFKIYNTVEPNQLKIHNIFL